VLEMFHSELEFGNRK